MLRLKWWEQEKGTVQVLDQNKKLLAWKHYPQASFI
jgi:hypothetical protein